MAGLIRQAENQLADGSRERSESRFGVEVELEHFAAVTGLVYLRVLHLEPMAEQQVDSLIAAEWDSKQHVAARRIGLSFPASTSNDGHAQARSKFAEKYHHWDRLDMSECEPSVDRMPSRSRLDRFRKGPNLKDDSG